jgi:hypothetical protein
MDARVVIGDKWEQLLRDLGSAAQLHVCSNDDGRRAAIIQLAAILDFFRGTAAESLDLLAPLHVLLTALVDLHKGGKPSKILTSQKPGHRQRDDVALQSVKVVAAVIMDQLCEHLSRKEAAKEVSKAFSEYGLSDFRGRRISATAITKWRDKAKGTKDPEFTRQFNRLRSMDTKELGQDASLERKRELLFKVRLPYLLIEFGARGPKAAETRQRLISEIGRLIPKKPIS